MEKTLEGLALLRKPFPEHQISYLPKGGVKLAYVGHAALTDRLLDADPAWSWEPLAMSDNGLPVLDPIGGMWIKLTVCGVTRIGYGHAGNKEGGDAIKEIIGDALRNAAMRFGAALELWHKGDLHLPDPMAEVDILAHLALINGAATAGELKRHTAAALLAAGDDATACARFNATAEAKAATARARRLVVPAGEELMDLSGKDAQE
jgi:hypothetical protein